MVDETTTNKNYPLPHPSNIASQDVTRIATAISMIDEDISSINTSIGNMDTNVQSINSRALRIPEDKVGIINTELQNLEARKYITVNSAGTGFTTVEGGGGEGGKKGEILIKKSDENFDTTWIDPRAVLSKAFKVRTYASDVNGESNTLSRINDEIDCDSEQVQRVGISPRQITEDVTADSFSGYILTDEIEGDVEDDDFASKEKFGRVKVGSGINVENGVISVPTIGVASRDELGLVKIGDGIDVSRGVISVPEYQQATSEEFGTVKLSDDFMVGSNGELRLAQLAEDIEPIIYQSARLNVCNGNTVVVQENCARYRLFISEDSVITFDWSLITPQDDIAFDVELYASNNYVISFSDSQLIMWEIPCTAVVPGKTVVRFSKNFNTTFMNATMVEQDEYPEKYLTVYNGGDDIGKNYKCNILDGAWSAGDYFNPDGNWYWSYISSDGYGILQTEFMRSTYVQRINAKIGSDWVIGFFYIEGSKDGINWIRLYSVLNQKLGDTYNIELNNKGLYRYYRFRHSDNMYFGRIKFYGYDVDDRLFELRKITPRMFTNSTNGFKLTSHVGVDGGNLYNITNNDLGQYAQFSSRDENQDWWIKYELPEAKVVDFIDFGHGNDRLDLAPKWFKIEGSNDDSEWTLLVERQYEHTLRRCHGEQYFIENTTAYKYYKLTIHETEDANYCRIYRWRLFKTEDGIRKIDNFIPKMLSASQDGYEVSANSQYNAGHAAFYAFDGNANTRWSSSGSAPDWIRIKFPEAVECNAVEITSRNDGSYNQAPRDFTIQASNDGTTWDTLSSEFGVDFSQNETKLFDFDNENSYQYYRLYVTANNGGSTVAIGVLKFGRIVKDYKLDLNRYERIVPLMTSNSQDGYIVTASDTYSGGRVYYPYLAFNNVVSDSDSWSTKNQSGWLQVELPRAKKANMLKMSGGFANEEPDSFILYGSNDGENYIQLLDSGTLTWSHNETKTWDLENDTAYKFYKIEAENTKKNFVTISEFQLINHSIIKEY